MFEGSVSARIGSATVGMAESSICNNRKSKIITVTQSVTDIEQWETCQIEARVLPGSRLHPQHNNGQSMFWFRFVAVATLGEKSYVVGRSDRASFPFSTTGQSQTAPKPIESLHSNTLEPLLHQLRREGWEPVNSNKQRWWEYRFRRQARPEQQSAWQRFTRWFFQPPS